MLRLLSVRGNSGGFSLIEALFATAIFTAGVGMLAELLLLGEQTVSRSRSATESAIFAQQKMEQLRGAPPGDSPPNTLNANVSGYWDRVDGSGHVAYLRRWSVRIDSVAGAAVIQVLVSPGVAAGIMGRQGENAFLETVAEQAR